MDDLPISATHDGLREAADEADLLVARESLASTEPRIPHDEVLTEFGLT